MYSHAMLVVWFAYLCSEVYEGDMWHNDRRLWTPMTTLTDGQHIFIGDIVDINAAGCLSGKVVKFVEVSPNCMHC